MLPPDFRRNTRSALCASLEVRRPCYLNSKARNGLSSARRASNVASPNNHQDPTMNNTRAGMTGVEDLAHRRRLAAARQSREIERASLLQKLIETQQKALELRKWITQWETKEQASSPEVQRLIKWAKATLSDSENFLLPTELTKLLEVRGLFPEVDDLTDPLGEPPPLRPWGR
jgi:hypothetical protein